MKSIVSIALRALFFIWVVDYCAAQVKPSTFGKPKSAIPDTPDTTSSAPRARDCNSHQDCMSLENTSCVRDPIDSRLRCLCGDNKPPSNGACKSKLKGLRHLCQQLTDCEDGMVCQAENTTKPAAFGQKIASASIMVCLCDVEGGWEEDLKGHHCSGSTSIATSAWLSLGLVAVVLRYSNKF